VPVLLVDRPEGLNAFERALRDAVDLAVDTETVVGAGDEKRPGPMRVLSAATRGRDGQERAWVVDVRDVPGPLLAPLLGGRTARAWNATFDALVTDAAVFEPAGRGRDGGLQWWDGQLADAVLHAGFSGFAWFHGLAWATERYLGVEAEGKGTVQLSFDAHRDLRPEQVRYAAADAVETLWVADALQQRLARHGLAEVAALEMAARPFLDHLQRSGLPFDAAGYTAYLDGRRRARAGCLTELAELTGGGQGNLFGPEIEPAWNPGSEQQAKAALNRWAAGSVRALFARREGGAGRLLADADPLDATTLAEIGGPLARALLAYRAHAKLLSAYGDNLLPLVEADGRFHPRYVQVVGVNTGRLSSRAPNAQTFPPEMKPFLRPERAGRVYVHADVGQAELRWLAQVSGDRALRDAFAAGLDVHIATAERMFGLDMAETARRDPARFAVLRARAKTINFGIVYGQGAAALGRSLTLAGSPTDTAEAQRLLDAYLAAYPDVAAWLAAQDATVDAMATRAAEVDWDRTLRLYDDIGPRLVFRRQFRDEHRRWPSARETRAALPDVTPWTLAFEEGVLLLGDGRPLRWSSRTLAGRRRQFTISTSGVLRRVGLLAAVADQARLVGARDRFAARHHVDLAGTESAIRALEDRPLRRAFVGWLWEELGRATAVDLLARAASDAVRAAGNAYRNAPIQGGVADAMLAAYAELWASLRADRDLSPAVTVHDSVAVECSQERADEVGAMVLAALERGFGRWCPDVPLAVEIDVRSSLSDSDVIRALDPPSPGGTSRSAPSPSPRADEPARNRAAPASAAPDTADGVPPKVSP
jgi:DNA polymerase I-like protein with 3'-5' exonuclease and polymerase domains